MLFLGIISWKGASHFNGGGGFIFKWGGGPHGGHRFWWGVLKKIVGWEKLNWRNSYYSCVDGDLKRQIKNRRLHISRLFLLTKTFHYTRNWWKASWAFTHPLIQYAQSRYNKFRYTGLYNIKRANTFISHSWYTSNIESVNKKEPVISVAFFIWYNFSIRLWLQRRGQ